MFPIVLRMSQQIAEEQMKVALYLRVSTDKQEADNQRMQLRQLCQAQGWRIVREYQDTETGSRADRIEFRQMLNNASRRKWDLLVF